MINCTHFQLRWVILRASLLHHLLDLGVGVCYTNRVKAGEQDAFKQKIPSCQGAVFSKFICKKSIYSLPWNLQTLRFRLGIFPMSDWHKICTGHRTSLDEPVYEFSYESVILWLRYAVFTTPWVFCLKMLQTQNSRNGLNSSLFFRSNFAERSFW